MDDDEPEEVDFDYDEADSYLIQDPRRPNTLTADALSLLNELFESNKSQDNKIKTFFLDLKSTQTMLMKQKQGKQRLSVPIEVFDIFFGTFMKRKTIIT